MGGVEMVSATLSKMVELSHRRLLVDLVPQILLHHNNLGFTMKGHGEVPTAWKYQNYWGIFLVHLSADREGT